LQINNRDLEEDFQRQISDREAQIRHLQSMLKEGKEQQKSNRVESDLAKRELEQKRSALFF
jgi:Arc/MetJ-type ribon-helix-helix transcriptional regulator